MISDEEMSNQGGGENLEHDQEVLTRNMVRKVIKKESK